MNESKINSFLTLSEVASPKALPTAVNTLLSLGSMPALAKASAMSGAVNVPVAAPAAPAAPPVSAPITVCFRVVRFL